MYEINEVMNLAIDILSLPVVIVVLKTRKIPHFRLFIAALACIFLSHLLTIVEGFCFPVVCNILEHISFTIAAILFLSGLICYFHKGNGQS